jgi:predicted enzyme related to lactoylglutathione lyase
MCAGLALFGAVGTVSADVLRPPALNAKAEPRLPGKFIWFDCVTDDTYAAKAFYGVVFGWDFHSIGSGTGRYTLIENRGRNIGGLHFRPKVPGSPQGSRWLSLFSVDDPAVAVRYVETHGGKVIVAPTVFEGRGTHALFRDDDGAVFGVLKSDTGDPPDAPPVAGEFLWLDLLARDPKKAAEFYRGMVGYDVAAKETPARGSRIVLKTGGVTRAVVIALPKELATPGWLPFVQVDDVAATVARATANGGKIVFAPRPDYFGGQVAVIADPQGAVVGIVNQTEALKKGPAK